MGCGRIEAHSRHWLKNDDGTRDFCYGMSSYEYAQTFDMDGEYTPETARYSNTRLSRHLDDEHFAASWSEREMTGERHE